MLQDITASESNHGLLPTPPLPEGLPTVELTDNARQVLVRRYVRRGPDGQPVETVEEMFWRVAYHVAAAEEQWGGEVLQRAREFYQLLTRKQFFPNSPTFTGAGTPLGQLSACFVLAISDDMGRDQAGIFQTLRDAALIQQTGGGNGFSFSRLRPKNSLVKSSAGQATGPVGFLRVYDKAFGEIAQGGSRRGANMAVLRVDHPDIEEFITCKTDENAITNFNISVGVTDAFMRAAEADDWWELRFPDVTAPEYHGFNGTLEQAEAAGIPIKVYRRVRARELFAKIVRQAHHNGEPGVLFLDAANRANPVPHLYQLEATNPCATGETLVATPSGWRRADTIREGEEICTVLGTGRVATVEVNENMPVFDLYLSDGAVIRVTASHQFHARDSRRKFFEPRRLDELAVGDWVRVYPTTIPNNSLPSTGVELADRDYGFLIGVLVGDGCYTPRALSKNIVRIGSHDDEEEWNALLKQEFAKIGVETMYTYVNEGSHSMMMDPKPGRVIASWVRSLPLEPARGPEKRLPEIYINSNREFLTGLLDGLFSTDGSVDLSSNHPIIRFHTSSSELARQVRRILLMFGIHGRLSRSMRKRHYIEGREIRTDRPMYDVLVSGMSFGRFFEQIRLSHPKKQRRIEQAALFTNFTGGNWAAQVRKIEPAGTATVYDLYEPRSDTWIAEGYVSRGCAEQWLGPNENCCLGSINLAQHFGPEGSVDWEKLRRNVALATRFLDDVVDANAYVPAVPQLKEAAHNARRIGLGIMGLADLMYHAGIRYGSQEGQEFAAQVMEFVRYHAMLTSVELAAERRAFPAIRGSIYDPERMSWQPPRPLAPYSHDWGRPEVDWSAVVDGIHRHGIRNAAQTTIAPTGCLVAGTMVVTDHGLLPIETLGDPNGERWQEINFTVFSERQPQSTNRFYVNGVAHTIRVVTRRGYEMHGTDGHRIRVWENGEWVWRRIDELQPGMITPLLPTGLIGQSHQVTLDTTFVTDFHVNPVTLPDKMTADLAYLIGFFMGDGSLKTRTLRFSVPDPLLRNTLNKLLQKVFEVPTCVAKDNRSANLESLEVHSLNLVAFWQRNGFARLLPDEEHSGKGYRPHVPMAVLRTNDVEVYGAFLAGLFDADATVHGNHHLTWLTVDPLFHQQVKSMMLALGILTTSDRHKTGLGQSQAYRLRTAHAEAAMHLAQKLPYLRRAIPSNGHVRCQTLRDTIPLSSIERDVLLSMAGSKQEEQMAWAWRQRKHASRASLRKLVEAHRTELAEFEPEIVESVERPVFYDEIQIIEDGGWQNTYDLSVPGSHAYIANGFVSHNTIATVAGCEGYGCEPVFALAYVRHVNDNGKDLQLTYASPQFEAALKAAGVKAAARRKIVERVMEHGTCQDIPEAPEAVRRVFVVSQDISAEEHVRMQAALQAFTDNAISKTVNFPAAATEADVATAYKLAWELGCKGLTVYVTGSRQKVVLETKATARQKEAAAPEAPAKAEQLTIWHEGKKPRPRKLHGYTFNISTPVGKAFVTINENGSSQPFEVFVNTAKAGSETAAVSEAIGRLISYVLRLPSPLAPRERLMEVFNQLSGIGGGRSLGFGPNRVRSLPDGVAQALAEYLESTGEGPREADSPGDNGRHVLAETALSSRPADSPAEQPFLKIGDLCPECGEAAVVNEEGCRKCYACGYSEC